MSGRILILGAAGRLGYAAAEAFRDAGWTVVSLVRPGAGWRAAADTIVIEDDGLHREAVLEAAPGADVVLHHRRSAADAQQSLDGYVDVYTTMGLVTVAIGLALVFSSRLLNKMMHGVE